eukprot:scaffold143064_cov16-Tisochrysis_lutea.AAC.1
MLGKVNALCGVLPCKRCPEGGHLQEVFSNGGVPEHCFFSRGRRSRGACCVELWKPRVKSVSPGGRLDIKIWYLAP